MASLGHVIVGMAAARAYRGGGPARWTMAAAMAAWALLSLLPDADVIGFPLGVRYGDEWGHRGATHSIAFALILATAIAFVGRLFRLPPLRTGLTAGVVLASHGLLDSLTDGGLGAALLWPLDLTRYFAPWQPIPVAPIGLDFLSAAGLMVSIVEIVLFAPLLWLALRGATRPPIAGLAVWAVAIFLITWRGDARDNVLGYFMREDVEFAPAYSGDRFRAIRQGQSEVAVFTALGEPLGEVWVYGPELEDPENVAAKDTPRGCFNVVFRHGLVEEAAQPRECSAAGITPATPTSRADVRRILGPPAHSCWEYTLSPSNSPYRGRIVCFANGSVRMTVAQWMPGQ